MSADGTATAADGHEIAVCGTGELKFELWGTSFVEPVRVAENISSKVLMGSQFWRRYGLVLNLGTLSGNIWFEGGCVQGKAAKKATNAAETEQMAAISDAEVGDALRDMDLSQFHGERHVQGRLRNVLWRRRAVFKGLGKIKGVQHQIKLVQGANPSCCPVRRRSPREEEVERKEMKKCSNWVSWNQRRRPGRHATFS